MELDLKVTSKDINEILWRNRKTLSVAESCTSGRVASVITSVPGSSQYFRGGIIAYSDEVKIKNLGVSEELLNTQTAVSEEVVKAMVLGANQMFESDYAVAISGFAGPGGVENGKNAITVGTIWIAVGNEEEVVTTMLEEDNGRDKNLASATNTAIHMLSDYLKKHLDTTTEE